MNERWGVSAGLSQNGEKSTSGLDRRATGRCCAGSDLSFCDPSGGTAGVLRVLGDAALGYRSRGVRPHISGGRPPQTGL